ncbi:hypothetical protein [Ochrobactrum sp. RH2CCR150]|uniref:hypothetical protein n=1 Tax=Ochrobactrum sp. RH2CCR150 TaxID=2587044 RepID=UPI0015FAF4B6|nr:hypothetical protein [Ochrobactrum sp. RH2CCR150]
MNIAAAIANFGARFGAHMRTANYATASSGQTTYRHHYEAEASGDKAVGTASRLMTIWYVNPENGRVECRWTKDSDEIAQYRSLPVLERFGLLLAAGQQNRTSTWAH